jgi:hypothetical protein
MKIALCLVISLSCAAGGMTADFDGDAVADDPQGASSPAVDEKKKPSTLTSKVLGSGDVLLSHGLSPYYHRGCSVSLPCSEWERVGPLRYCHQSAEPHWQFRCCRSDASVKPNLWGLIGV